MAQKPQHYSPLALTYARALLELANERKLAEDTGRELAGLSEILTAEPVFREYLSDPAISHAERTASLERIFRGRVSELIFNFMGVMNSHGRLKLLGEVLSAYADLLDKQLGNVEVDVTTAQQLSEADLEQVRQSVGHALGKNAIVHQHVDESIIGGLMIQVDDKVIDASVRQQLRGMRQQLLAAAQKVHDSSGTGFQPVQVLTN
ncbi:MAG TPA: ATP synthase F1 subunit delta [Tepidisphaeraceae bacterium]|nr:ATP synthase F1 subunit delta [Tepidisphaeraceae bacterium]